MPSSPAIGVALVASWGVALCKGNVPSAACSAPPIIPVGTPGEAVAHSIFVWEPTLPGLIKEHQRSFLLRLPTNYYVAERDSDGDIDGGRVIPGPLVLDIHGYTSYAEKQYRNSGFSEIADRHGFVGIWPNGSDDTASGTRGWNCLGTSEGVGDLGPTCNLDRRAFGEYECYDSCGTSCKRDDAGNALNCVAASCWDDVGFLTKLLDWLELHVCFDVDRLHLTGLSNGAFMVYQLAHSLSDRIASIAPVAGLPLLGHLESATPTSPVALLDTHGLLDNVVPANYSNGFLGRVGPHGSTWSADGFYYTPLDNITAAFAEVNKCAPPGSGAHRVYETKFDGDMWWHCIEPHGDCATGASVVRCSSLVGHMWPFYYNSECFEEVCPHVEFAELAFSFFSKHPRVPSVV